METVHLSFTFRNWVTVVIMAALGFGVLGLGAQLYKKYSSNKAAA